MSSLYIFNVSKWGKNQAQWIYIYIYSLNTVQLRGAIEFSRLNIFWIEYMWLIDNPSLKRKTWWSHDYCSIAFHGIENIIFCVLHLQREQINVPYHCWHHDRMSHVSYPLVQPVSGSYGFALYDSSVHQCSQGYCNLPCIFLWHLRSASNTSHMFALNSIFHSFAQISNSSTICCILWQCLLPLHQISCHLPT